MILTYFLFINLKRYLILFIHFLREIVFFNALFLSLFKCFEVKILVESRIFLVRHSTVTPLFPPLFFDLMKIMERMFFLVSDDHFRLG